MATDGRSGPPRPPFVVSVGVTGHRAKSLGKAVEEGLAERIGQCLELVELAGGRAHQSNERYFSDAAPRFRLISPLADGTDQAAAEAALALGWEVQAILPFDRARYRASLANEAARVAFDRLIDASTVVLELPGDGDGAVEDYVMAGRATVAHSDMLIAVWDGEPARGRGGTADVAAQAIATGTGLIHLRPDADTDARLIWAAFDPTVVTTAAGESVARPCEAAHLEAMLRAILLPPPDQQERQFLDRYSRERLHAFRARIEYPLLLSLFGVRAIGIGDIAESHGQRQIEEEWRTFRTGCPEANKIDAPIGPLEGAYAFADRLATHFAQTYRSGHIFSFALGGLAVCLGLSAFIAPQLKLYFALAEMVIAVAIIANAMVGNRREWHRRWLDYRQLAERLRPMRSLKMLGLASPEPPGTRTNPVPRRWIDWYGAAIWRAMGAPGGAIDRVCASRLAVAIADHEVEPQVRYHRRNAHQVETLDHRLEIIGTAMFAATLLVAGANFVGIVIEADYIERFGDWFNLIEAGFPALGTAIFGIRFQADFGGDALRSLATADTLEEIDSELRKNVDLTRAADLAEEAARIMLSDLDEWRMVNQQRQLEMG